MKGGGARKVSRGNGCRNTTSSSRQAAAQTEKAQEEQSSPLADGCSSSPRTVNVIGCLNERAHRNDHEAAVRS